MTLSIVEKIWLDIKSLQEQSHGEGVKVAVLDGSVDLSHPCFDRINTRAEKVQTSPQPGPVLQHGTHVASILVGQEFGVFQGLVPASAPIFHTIFRDRSDGSLMKGSQTELAQMIEMALDQGADIINISAGEKAETPKPDRMLDNATKHCEESGVLLVLLVTMAVPVSMYPQPIPVFWR